LSVLTIATPEVFEPLLSPARYKGAWGGRGSGKSHFFAEMLVEDALRFPGLRAVCIREVQKSLKESAKRLVEDKIQTLGVGSSFDVLEKEIRGPGGGVIMFQGMQDHTAESIKSLEGFDRAWIEEAQSLSQRSLTLLRPTIRKDGSEIWASWNPRRKLDAVDQFLRGDAQPESAVVVKANWRDNPFFPDVLEQERLHDLKHFPDRYDHVWEGGYATVTEGAYFAHGLTVARQEKRIGHVAGDPLMATRAYWDIGGTGAKADACAIWIVQFIGREIRVLDYYEAVGQPLAEHLAWLRSRGYERAECILPHDGATNDKVYSVSYESAIREAGFSVRVVPNSGKGAASQRIEAVRRLFPLIWFNEATTEPGRDALGWYHEKKDEERNVGLGPEHDWSSHGADAFGLMAMDYSAPSARKPVVKHNVKWVV
jgi:phage terminase large subunit